MASISRKPEPGRPGTACQSLASSVSPSKPLQTSLFALSVAMAQSSNNARTFSPFAITSELSYQLLHRRSGRLFSPAWIKGAPGASGRVSAFGIKCESTKVPKLPVSLQTPCSFLAIFYSIHRLPGPTPPPPSSLPGCATGGAGRLPSSWPSPGARPSRGRSRGCRRGSRRA